MGELIAAAGLSDVDPRLLEEAFRRASRQGAEPDSQKVLAAIIAEAKRGTRDLHGLVRAAATRRSAA